MAEFRFKGKNVKSSSNKNRGSGGTPVYAVTFDSGTKDERTLLFKRKLPVGKTILGSKISSVKRIRRPSVSQRLHATGTGKHHFIRVPHKLADLIGLD